MNWKMLLLLTSLALALLISWLEPSLRESWNAIDLSLFRLLNNSLETQGSWSNFWAIMNYRLADLLPLSIMAIFLIVPGFVFDETKVREGLFGFITLLVFMLIVREAFDFIIELFAWTRSSPTLSLDNVYRLSEMYPQLNPKDSSTESFPGDHAGVVILWASYCLSFARNKWSFAIIILTAFFMLPRLVGGGHWLSDDLVGGGVIAILTLAWVRYSLIFPAVTPKLVAWFSPLINSIGRLISPLQAMAFFAQK